MKLYSQNGSIIIENNGAIIQSAKGNVFATYFGENLVSLGIIGAVDTVFREVLCIQIEDESGAPYGSNSEEVRIALSTIL